MHVRPAEPADLAAITRIYGHHVLNGLASFELEAPTLDEMRRRYDELRDKGFPYLVAERDGAVLGYAYAGAYRARPAYRFSVENSVYIDPAARRSGVGKALLRALLAECERMGFRTRQIPIRSACMRRAASSGSARCRRSAGSSAAGSTRC